MRVRSTEKRVLLLLGDFLAAFLALWIGLYFWSKGDAWLSFSTEFLKIPPGLVVLVSSTHLVDLDGGALRYEARQSLD